MQAIDSHAPEAAEASIQLKQGRCHGHQDTGSIGSAQYRANITDTRTVDSVGPAQVHRSERLPGRTH